MFPTWTLLADVASVLGALSCAARGRALVTGGAVLSNYKLGAQFCKVVC
jgi:hypothetical protein